MIVGLPADRKLHVWKERTGKSQATMYRRLEERGREDSQGFDI